VVILVSLFEGIEILSLARAFGTLHLKLIIIIIKKSLVYQKDKLIDFAVRKEAQSSIKLKI